VRPHAVKAAHELPSAEPIHTHEGDAMTPLRLYTNPMSRGRIARWMLEESGLPYEAVILDYGTTMKASDYLAINPMGKVPTLVHGDAVITECAAVCAYVAELVPDKKLAPPIGSAARAAYLRWLFFAAGPVEAAVTAKAFGLLVPAEKSDSAGYGTFDAVMRTLEHAVSKASPWLCGEDFTAADVYVGSQLSWGLQFGSIERRPAFEPYVARLREREAAKRAAAIDDALIAKAKAAAASEPED
jgi:glutathione S-transferase